MAMGNPPQDPEREHSILQYVTVRVFLFVYEISWELLNGFAPNSRGRHVSYLARMSLNVKVKGQGHQGQKMAFFDPFGGLRALYIW